MKHISGNTAEVAKLPLKMNLQLFSGDLDVMEEEIEEQEGEEIEESNEEIIESEEGAEEPAPAKQEPVRDLEKDSAFAEIRRKAEAAERRANELEQQNQKQMEIARKYGQYGVFSDADVSAKYGAEGIHSLADLDRELQRQELVANGMDPDVVNKYVDEAIKNHPDMVAARQAKQAAEKSEADHRLVSQFMELRQEFPGLVKAEDGSDIDKAVWEKWNDGKSGLSLTDAYTIVNRKAIIEQQQAASIQAAKNQLNSKSHLKPSGGSGGELDTNAIPDDVMREYRRMFPKGKDTDFIKDYKKNNK